MVSCNTTLEDSFISETPLWKGVSFHHFGLFLAAVFGLVSIVVSLFLVFLHATHYLKPWEQRHIIRILLMIPIYSTVSFLSYLYYRHAVYFEVLRDCYEAFAIASFFTLLCHYIAPNLHDQKEYFRGMTPINWFWGVFFLQKCTGGEHKGPLRRPRSGLTWFNVSSPMRAMYCTSTNAKMADCLDRRVPILLRSGAIYDCLGRISGIRSVLRGLPVAGLCTYLGDGIRVCVGHHRHVLLNPVLSAAQRGFS